jgi:hypothetical protein
VASNPNPNPNRNPARVALLGDAEAEAVSRLLGTLGLRLRLTPSDAEIPGSYWGAPEAGLVGDELHARSDTPIHSVLHEASHYVCMSDSRRAHLDRDAGGDDLEESAVCYLQILLADLIPCMGRERMFHDMDAWGYSFRLGSTRRWFENDAEDARGWLTRERLLDPTGTPTLRRRR